VNEKAGGFKNSGCSFSATEEVFIHYRQRSGSKNPPLDFGFEANTHVAETI
jgi:hypothetical protein